MRATLPAALHRAFSLVTTGSKDRLGAVMKTRYTEGSDAADLLYRAAAESEIRWFKGELAGLTASIMHAVVDVLGPDSQAPLETALCKAALMRHQGAVQQLLQARAPVNAEGSTGETHLCGTGTFSLCSSFWLPKQT